MSHARTQIRDAVVTLLGGLATTGSRVYPSRIYPLTSDGANLPGLCIYTVAEEIDDEAGKAGQYQVRSLTIEIDGYVEVVSGIDDVMDTISAEVETALYADRFLGDRVKSLDLVSNEMAFATGEKPLGVIKMIFLAQYFTMEGAPEIIV